MIDSQKALREVVARLGDEPCMALDTEFVWDRTYYARLGLIQVGLASGVSYLVDPVAIVDLSPLGEILSDSRITKILHDAPQDLMHLKRATGASATAVFDTRVAAGFAGLSSVLSLANLVSELLDVHLPKEHTRVNWMARPLRPEYLDYAVDDVLHLPEVAEIIRQRVRAGGTEAWLTEELATLSAPGRYDERPINEAYLRIRAAASLRPRSLAALRELAAWREERARRTDKPRRWLMEDAELVSVAAELPQNGDALCRCKKLQGRSAQRYEKDLLDAVERGLAVPEKARPSPVFRPSRDQKQRSQVDTALEQIVPRAQSRQIDPQIVCSKGDLAMVLQGGDPKGNADHPLLCGWRAELLGDTLTVRPQGEFW
jgi:ribonuclease D